MLGKYGLVLEVIENFEEEDMLNDFKDEFDEGVDVDKIKFVDFCEGYINDCSEYYYIRKNWEYILSGGDYSVFDEE